MIVMICVMTMLVRIMIMMIHKHGSDGFVSL
eukprot:COSAG01_NODE_75_length_28415_cov_72.253267_3_plen_31_part_00